MTESLKEMLVVGITSRALFDLEEAHSVYALEGLGKYRQYQREREDIPLVPGTGFALVKALLNVNVLAGSKLVEVVLISRNDADTGLRVMNSIEASKLDITKAAFVGGKDAYNYLESFYCDLFLSANVDDVRAALKTGHAAALVFRPPDQVNLDTDEVRIAFDGDAVLFGPESDDVFRSGGLEDFEEFENLLEHTPLTPGPFKGFLDAISVIQGHFPEENCPIKTSLVTARGAPAHKRPIFTLRSWGVRLDQSFFLAGMNKSDILRKLKPHIFFDDQRSQVEQAASYTPSAQVIRNGNGTQ